ncbi:hypothetical protein R1flu_019067 [Riccia fluitans]|uniref:Uncharacterized protein n=1 Tax=Riccia fluitans TaxID=41844 RepID=A0ABD1ZHM0_9MARC
MRLGCECHRSGLGIVGSGWSTAEFGSGRGTVESGQGAPGLGWGAVRSGHGLLPSNLNYPYLHQISSKSMYDLKIL